MTYQYLLLAFPATMIFAAISDALTMTIPNRVSLFLLAMFPLTAILAGLSLVEIGLHLLSGLAFLSLAFGCFAMGWMGGGDAKLLAATAVWFGFTLDLASYLLLGAILGGVLTLLLVLVRSHVPPVTGVLFIDRLLEPKAGVPYGIALGLAGLVVFSESQWLQVS